MRKVFRDYAFTTATRERVLSATDVDGALKQLWPAIKASTVATHTEPWVVIVHCEGELTQEDRSAIQEILDNL